MKSRPLLSVESLQIALPTEQGVGYAVDGIDFSIRAGETLALLGESGCGKSMTALSLLGLLPPAASVTQGKIDYRGKDLLQFSENRLRQIRGRRLAMIFQEPMTALNPVMTVGDQIQEVLLRHQLCAGNAAKKRVLELLDAVQIPARAERIKEYPHQLSGGMKQRIMIAMALAADPEILIADEPTTALDVTIQAQILTLLKDLQRTTRMGILLITHDLGVVANYADTVAVMYCGQIVEHVSKQDLFAHPRHPYTQKLLDALPDIEQRGQSLAVIEGRVPALSVQPRGCRFAPRCERRWDLCEKNAPTLLTVEKAAVRCHLYAEGAEIPSPKSVQVAGQIIYEKADIDASSPLLQVNNLKVHYPIRKGLMKRVVNSVRAVDGIDISISPGETLALVGESGCGKTTVAKALLGLAPKTAGECRLNSTERAERVMQLIFQDPYSAMNPRLRVEAILSEGLLALGLEKSKAACTARCLKLLEQVGLPEDSFSRYPHEFSGGQRQRLCIARALAVEPKLLICDEPTSALDVSVQAQILNLLKQLQIDTGLAYLFITHDISVVGYLADRVAVMYLGRIVETGTTEAVLTAPKHPYTQALMAAVPNVTELSPARAVQLEGEVPSPISPPSGCHFHPRCSQATERCRTNYPSERRISQIQTVRCFNYSETDETL